MSGMRLSMRVWDLPIRLFHWLVTLLLLASYVTEHWKHFGAHILIGETLLVLLVWRVIWGFVGSDTARFGSFLRRPAAAFGHLARIRHREPDNQVGHNAAGGWWVVLALTLLAVQALSGLLQSKDYKKGGPLFHLLSPHAASVMRQVHAVNVYLLLGAIVLHVLAIGAYAMLKGQFLLRPMILGKKRMPAAMRAPRMASPVLALLVLLCAAAGAALALNGLSP